MVMRRSPPEEKALHLPLTGRSATLEEMTDELGGCNSRHQLHPACPDIVGGMILCENNQITTNYIRDNYHKLKCLTYIGERFDIMTS